MGDAAASLLPPWTAALSKGQLSSADDILSTLRSQPLLQEGALSAGGGRGKPNAAPEFIDAATQAVSKTTVDAAAPALRVLAAAIAGCDAATLLSRLPQWVPLLGDALRRAVAGSGNKAAAASGANGSAAASDPVAAAAACGALAALYRRLQPLTELPGVRREATTGLSKVLQQLLPLLQAADAGALSAGGAAAAGAAAAAALELLETLLQATPASLRQSQTALSAELPRLMCAAATATAAATSTGAPLPAAATALLCRAAVCVAALPRTAGDAAAWSECARGLLTSAHEVLDFLTMGLEGPPLDPRGRAALAKPGSGGSSSSAGQQQQRQGLIASLPWDAAAANAAAISADKAAQQRAAAALLGSLLSALEALATAPFPVAVPLPSGQLLQLAARLVAVDAAAAVAAGSVPPSTSRFSELLQQQPALHVAGWRLLRLLLAAGRGQLIPLQGAIGRVVSAGLRTVRLGGGAALLARPPAGREGLYLAAADAVAAGGLAAARGLAAEVLGAVLMELYGAAPLAGAAAANGRVAGAERAPKRARGAGGASDLGAFDPAAALAAAGTDGAARLAAAAADDLAAQAAALRLLAALLAAGGAALPAETRAHADAVAYHVARSAAAAAARVSRDPGTAGGGRGVPRGIATVRLAAYEALLASLLAPLPSRHPYLAQGLELLTAGRAEPGDAALRALCRGAAAALEALLRPRAAPLAGLRRFAGAEAVPPLMRPRMWSAVDAEIASTAPVAEAGAAAPVAGQLQQQQVGAEGRAQEVQAAAAVEQQQQQQGEQRQAAARIQQQHQERQQKEQEPEGPKGKRRKGEQQQQQQQQQQPEFKQVAPPPPRQQRAEETHPPPRSAAPTPPAPAKAPAAAPAPAAPLAAFAHADESSDSEGGLPDIDSGSGSESE